MRKNGDVSLKPTAPDGVVSRSARTSTFRALFRVISSGASTVARSAASAASSAVNRDVESLHDQVLWAGFDKLEKEDGDTRRVLLLAFHSGFQIWDVEETDNVHVIVSSHDGQASFMQMLPNPITSEEFDDRFSDSRPLLAVCGDSSWDEQSSRQSGGSDNPETVVVPTNVHVYSLSSQSYVHTLRFRSVIYTVRCSSRIVAVLQAAQIHCFDAKTLVKEYMIVTNSIAYGSLGVGYGPLAVGPRWIAYSGSRVADSSSTLFNPELITLSSSPSVAQFARESSRQIASGIVTLGDKGYKSFSRYCSEVLPNPYIPGLKGIGVANDNVVDADSIGMVVIKDIISKSVVTQFKAHKSPISALSFDPSGMLLVTASIQGHNINVFRILPRASTSTSSDASFVHLFRLQRGFTNAVIQDISFSNDSSLIAISSSRGTSHLFEINPEGEGNNAPLPLSAVNRIRSGNISGWMGTMSGAAAAAAGMVGGSLPGATASAFCYSVEQNKNNNHYGSSAATSDDSLKRNLLVFAPSGCMTQYALKANQVEGGGHEMAGFDFESGSETEGKVGVEPIRRWSMIQNQSRREMQDQHSDVYGGGASSDSKSRVFPEIVRKQSAEESWKVTKKGKARGEDKHQMYMSEAELQMYQPTQLPLWGRRNFRFQEWVLGVNEEESNGGGGEMEIEGIQTRTVEGRRRGLVPVWGYLQSPKPQQVMRESFQSPRNTTQGDHVVPLEGHGTETEFGVVHSKEENLRSEEESLRSEEGSSLSEEET
ncbi:autophagy-related protein 18f isoform X1 [Raphanus sativus]|uniref:Autophagy-related protein 18f isoform X1 n=1 Tax=Raphanus sativus TaxID=3726 RepID=A0A6J0MYD3_RAPSA|nr:autophagy-related protein 18f isoform X1 [Raphanus sativus]